MSLREDESDLHEFSSTGSRDAFNRIARRYLNFVYGVACREAGVDSHLAEDITQAVFLIFARRAASVRAATLSSWLFTTTRHVAANARKIAARRKHHERHAARNEAEMRTSTTHAHEQTELSDQLTAALAAQRESDRAIVLMRFVQGLEFSQIAQAMHLSDLAARKRLERAIDRVREFLLARGITTETSALSAAIGGVAQSAPFTVLAAPSAGAVTLAESALSALAWTQAKIAASILVAFTLTTAVVTSVITGGQAPGDAKPQAEVVAVATTEPTTTLVVPPRSAPNAPAGNIVYTGVISDPDGKPLEGVRVWSELITINDLTKNTSDEARAVTDANGRYTLPPLPLTFRYNFGQRSTERILHFDDPRYAIAWSGTIDGESSRDEDSQEYSLRLEPASEIRVKVVDKAGKPITGAEVSARLQHDGHHTYPLMRGYGTLVIPDRTGSIKTDEQGFARIERLPPTARASLTITHPDHAKFLVRDGGVRPGADEPFVATLEPGGRVRVQLDLTSGETINSAALFAVPRDPLSARDNNYARVTFDRDGVGTMVGFRPGTYDIKLLPDDDIPHKGIFKPARNITIRAGETTDALFEFTPGTRVHGRLIDPRTRLPVANTNVRARNNHEDPTQSVSLGRVSTGTDGRFEIRALPGELKLDIAHFVDGEQQYITKKFSVADDRPLDVGDIDVVPATEIRGRLVDTNGKPVIGRVGGFRLVRTADDGSFVIKLLSAPPKALDRMLFAFNHDQTLGASLMYDEKWTDPKLALPGAMLPALTLVPTATIIGQVVDDDGNAVTDADIAVNLKLSPMRSVSYSNATRAPWGPIARDGSTFAVHHLPVGLEFDIVADRIDKQAVIPLTDLQPGEVRDLGAMVPDLPRASTQPPEKTATVRGKVVKEDGTAAPGARVNCFPVAGRIGRDSRDTTDHAGRFVLDGLPDGGELTVQASFAGFDTAARRVIVGTDNDIVIELHATGTELIGQPAPELTVSEWLNGPETRLADLHGKVVLLEMNTIIHMMQRQYIRELFSTAEKYAGKDVVILAVHRPIVQHEPGERLSKQDILDYLKSHPMPFAIAMDSTEDQSAPSGRTIADYLIREDDAIYFVIDKKGIVRAVPARNETDTWIDKLLAEKGE